MFSFSKPIFVTACIFLLVKLGNSVWIRSPRVTNFGDWGPEERCPINSFVNGIQVKVEDYQGKDKDDTALNGVTLSCIELNYPETQPFPYPVNGFIRSREGNWGNWKPTSTCEKGIALGFQLRSEPYQGKSDDFAANDIKLRCFNTMGNSYDTQTHGLTYGDWTSPQQCPNMMGVCGIQVQVEGPQGNGDDTSVNNVDLLCCELPNPAALCKAQDDWEEIWKRDFSSAVTPTSVEVREKIGVNRTVSQTEGGSIVEEVTHSAGFGLGVELFKFLGLNFEASVGHSTTTEYYWSRTETTAWFYETEETMQFVIPAGCVTTLYQVVGKCGPYHVKVNSIKRVDACKDGTTETFIKFQSL